MMHWLDELAALPGTGEVGPQGTAETQGCPAITTTACVLISIVGVRGSCPRDPGTHMIVTRTACHGTVGGGHLEYRAIDIARTLLGECPGADRLERFPLGARLGQCCGGTAYLLFERIPTVQPSWLGALQQHRRTGGNAVLVTELPNLSNPSDAPPFQSGKSVHPMGNPAPANGLAHRAHAPTPKRVVTSIGVSTGRLSSAELTDRATVHAHRMLSQPGTVEVEWQGSLMYEPVTGNDFHIAIFGAGHVGQALVHTLSTLPCRIRWVDSRAAQFPELVAPNAHVVVSGQPEDEIDELPAGSYVVIMTHSHAQDESICERALRRDDLAWCGLIGSLTKRRRFEHRLTMRGVCTEALAELSCPIGIDGIDGKHPAEIAIAVSADILQRRARLMSAAQARHQAA